MGRILAAALAGLAFVHGTPHADLIGVVNGRADTVRCGGGRDVVVAELADRVARDCETVSRRVSVDRTAGLGEHQSEVEPGAAGFGSAVVAAFEVGRFAGGGAEAIGFASSRDGGRSWESGLLPGVTAASGGPWPRASDPAVAYDARHGVWLVASLALGSPSSGLVVSRSVDGAAWEAPVTAGQAELFAFDKEWLACDNGAGSPQQGSCYLVWSDVLHGGLASQTSRDGGLTWSAPVAAVSGDAVGVQPVVLPGGTLELVFAGPGGILAVRSQDGGASFGAALTVSDVHFAQPRSLRAPSLPSVAVDGGGRVYVVWSDCRLEPGCTADDILSSSSVDGVGWSAPARVAAAGPAASAVVPAVGAGAAGRIAVTYYAAGATIGVRFVQSGDGGATWSAPQRLDATPMRSSWLASTADPEGRNSQLLPFLGDYIATPFVSGRPLPVFPLATAQLREAIFAAVTLK
jgi:hypothetical protein